MRVIHSGSCDVRAGGPALSTWLTIKGLRTKGVDAVSVMEQTEESHIISKELNAIFSENSKFGGFAYVPHLAETLTRAGEADIYHIQGVWMLHGWQTARFARKMGKPYVVTLRGMLYPQALAHHQLQKRVSLALYQSKVLREAAAIQCTCIEEMEHYRTLGFRNPVAVIPNPIEIEPYYSMPLPLKPNFRIGYLGRLHPRKRVERLIHAVHYLRTQKDIPAELMVIGGGDREYENMLREKVARLGLEDAVIFAGFLTGKEKDDAINSISVLGVPSDFENFGNIVTEALVRGIPVISSTGTPWLSLTDNHCGWCVPNDQTSINNTLIEAYSLGHEDLRQMGLNGKEWMRRDFSVETLGAKMLHLYSWLLGKGEKPDFVDMEDNSDL